MPENTVRWKRGWTVPAQNDKFHHFVYVFHSASINGQPRNLYKKLQNNAINIKDIKYLNRAL